MMSQIIILIWVSLLVAQVNCKVETSGHVDTDDINEEGEIETLPKIPTLIFEKRLNHVKPHHHTNSEETTTTTSGADQYRDLDLADYIIVEFLAIAILSISLVTSLLFNFQQWRANRRIVSLSKEVISHLLKDLPYHSPSRGIIKLELNELPKNSFTIDEASLLGSGSFGKVYIGEIAKDGYTQKVAVKVMKQPKNNEKYVLMGLLYQARNLSYLGRHAHVVNLKGIYSAELHMGRLLLFVELCELGSLLDYLRKAQPGKGCSVSVDLWIGRNERRRMRLDSSLEMNGIGLEETLVCDMYRWSVEIGSAMEFIASKHTIHGDISAKNVLLTGDKRAKLSGLGLPRHLHDPETSPEPIAWRQMAPESLQLGEYSEKSDVWAFGIFLWEIYTLGMEPYGGITWDGHYLERLQLGLRPEFPKYNTRNMHLLMKRCWNWVPKRRPNFKELVSALNMNAVGNYEVVEIHFPPLTNLVGDEMIPV